MNLGKTLFAQIMEFVPWTSFARIVARYGGDSRVRSLACTEQFRAMAFAQLTYRESLRDIETCLLANQTKLYGMGFRSPVRRSTLADANEGRDWRIWENLAALLIRRARKLYCNDSFGVDLDNTVYALDATTIDLCLSLFPWAPFRTAKAAVKLHTLLDLRCNIPAFIHISDGKTHEVNVLDMLSFEAGAFYVMDRGYLDFSRLFALHQTGAFFVTRAKRGMDAHRVYSMPADRSTGIITLELLRPVHQAQLQSVRGSRVITMDETPVKAGGTEHGQMKTGYFWLVYGEQDEICFLFYPDRQHKRVAQALQSEHAPANAVLLTDGYSAYAQYANRLGLTHAQCWVHSRRKFHEARNVEPGRSEVAMNLISQIYRVEEEIRAAQFTGKEKQSYQLKHSKPVVDSFFAWIEEQFRKQDFLPSSPLTEAMNYARER